MEKMPANLLKKNSTIDTQLQTFVDKQPKKQFFCEHFENFVTATAIKASFRVIAEFSTSHTYNSCIN